MARKTKKKAGKSRPTNTSVDRTTKYALDVGSGEIIAGPHVRNACARHLLDLKEGPKRGLVWDIKAADRVLSFFPDILRLNGGQFEGKPFELLPEQMFIVGSLFGWKGSDGFRRFRVAFVESGKGSGKTPLAAAIGIYMMTADGEDRAEIYSAAVKKDQAKVLFRDAVAMVQQSPALSRRLSLSGGHEKNNIAYLEKGSFFRPIATEDRGVGQSGPRPHCALLDEVHEHPTNAMVEFQRAGTKWRRQALIFMITNSGSNRESVCYEYHAYGVKVCAGDIEDDSFFAYICALDDGEIDKRFPADDPFKDEACWPKVNPALGVTISHKYLREQVTQARGMPSKENLVRRLNFCQWTDATDAWVSKEIWDACEATLNLNGYEGRRAHGGLDLGSKKDLTALAFAFEADEDGYIDAFVEFWTPKDTLKDREDSDRVPYTVWEKEGHLNAVPGKSINYAYVAQRIGEIGGDYDIAEIGYDRHRIDDLIRELDAEGVECWKASDEDEDYEGPGIKLTNHGQGFVDMGKAVEAIEEVILNGKLRVHTNPVLRWNAASVVLDEDAAGNRKFTKRKSTGRIDGIVALAMAVRLAAAASTEAGKSIYEEEDFFI